MRISDWSSDVCSSDLELTTALKAIDAAVSRGDIRIENDRLVVPKLKAAPEDERLKAIRRELFAGVGKIQDRKSVVWGKSVSVRVDLGGRRIIKQKILNDLCL